MAFKMKKSPYSMKSPLKTDVPHKEGTMNPNFVDTDWSRNVYTDERVQHELEKRGYDWDTLGSDPDHPNRVFLAKPKEIVINRTMKHLDPSSNY